MAVFARGEFSAVFRIDCPGTGQSWAIKCYTRELPGLRNRYAALAEHFGPVWPDYLVDCRWLDRGIRVGGQWYPCLRMPWLEGMLLGHYVRLAVDQPRILWNLAESWLKLAERMRTARIAHCDLHPGNILLVPDTNTKEVTIKLTDCDAIYVPTLFDRSPKEFGHPAFQHPRQEFKRDYGPDVDRFSHLVIYASLVCFACGGRALWDQFGDEERLLLRHRDLASPERSEVFRFLWGMSDSRAQDVIGHLILAAHGSAQDTPRLDHLVPNGAIVPLTPRERRLVNAAVVAKQWPCEYHAEISVKNPTCLVILVQQSSNQRLRGEYDRAAAILLERANNLITSLVFRCSSDTRVRDWFYVAAFLYGSTVSVGTQPSATGGCLASIGDVAKNPVRIENRNIQLFDHEIGETIEIPAPVPVWVKSCDFVNDESVLCEAIRRARQCVGEFIARFPDCYPPIVVNLGDGRSTDGNPSVEAAALRQMVSNDGAVLFYNACFIPESDKILRFPDNDIGLFSDDARMLFSISSQLCPEHQREATRYGFSVSTSSRGFSLNAGIDDVLDFYRLGTKAIPPEAVVVRPLVFISAKSDDYQYARTYYEFLTDRGLNVFLSCESLAQMGTSDYREAIDKALDEAKHMVVVTSSAQNVQSSWVKAEWGLFINEKRSDRKSGNIVTVAIGTLRIDNLPASLRYYEVISEGPESFERVYRYVSQ